ncbi:MAG: hypothetical protein Q9216_001682 [Gyalolechia sp. 2 TL-2023]
MQNGARGLYQYALLNLAILHADFGCFSEAITAMQETIATARENHDIPCLNYSLSWLHQLGRKHPEDMTGIQRRGILGSEKEALSFLKAKAKETNMWTLLSKTLLSEAKLMLSKGDSMSQAFESMIKAAHLNITHNTAESYGSQWLMQSSVFDRLGVGCQARVYTELFLECDARSSPVEDVLQSQCKNAHMVKSEGELHAGEQVLAQLHAAPAEVQELKFSLSVMEVELQVRRKDYPNALALLGKLLAKMDLQETDVFQRLKMMTLKARIYDKAGIPPKGFSVALRAASLAYNARLLPLLWEAVAAVCRILVNVREFDAGVKLAESVIPQALECEDCGLAASLFSCLADGHMGMAGQAKAGTLQRKERLTKTSEALDRAFDDYSRIEDVSGQCEMMAKKATIMHLNGDSVLANDCAAKYLDIKRAAREQS